MMMNFTKNKEVPTKVGTLSIQTLTYEIIY